MDGIQCLVERRLGVLVVVIVVIFFVTLSSCFAQTIPYTHYSITEGLPSSEVYTVYQDKKGFVWFGTDNGVVRYDGKDMDVFQTENGLIDPVSFEVVEDRRGRLWFRSFSGHLSYFENERINYFAQNDTIVNLCRKTFMESLWIDSKDNIWFGNGRNIFAFDSLGHLKEQGVANLENQLQLKKVEDHFLFSFRGPFANELKYNDRSLAIPFKELTSPRKVCTITWRGVDYFSIGTWIYKIKNDSIFPVFKGADQIISLSTDKDQNLWIGYLQSTLEAYSTFEQKLNLNLPFIKSKSVTGLIQDHQKGYWISTLQDGVYYVPEINFAKVDVEVSTKITATETLGEKTLIGDDKGQLLLLDSNGKQERKINLCKCVILSILPMPNFDLIWVMTSVNAYILNSTFKTFKSWPQSFTGLWVDAEGDIWCASGVYFYRFDVHGKALDLHEAQRPNRGVFGNSKYLFLYGRTGIEVLDQSLHNISIPKFFDNVKVSNIKQLNDSLLICGTMGNGFFVLNQVNWKFQEYSLKKGFSAANVYDILIRNGRLWMATEKGLAIVSEEQIVRGSPSFTFVTKKDGLANDKVNHLTNVGDIIWAYSESSICKVPSNFAIDSEPIFYAQRFLVNNQPFELPKQQSFPHDKNSIQFRFRVIDFKNQNFFFRYRLANNEAWIYTKDRDLKFYSLSPNDYSLEVEFSSDNFHWKNARILKFSILPPWWMDWRFQVAFLLILIALGFLFVKRRITRLKQVETYNQTINEYRQKLITIEIETLDRDRARIARDLHDSIGCNLAAIKLSVAGLLRKYDDPHASFIDKELQASIQEIRDIIRGMTPEGFEKSGLVELVREYVKRITVGIAVDVEIQSSGEETRDGLVNLSSFRIIQELLSNSLKYASAKRILIQIEYTADLLLISYRDDGKGFDVQSVKKGSGISNIEARVRAMNAKLIFNSDGSGVFYRVEIALNKINFVKLNGSQNGQAVIPA